MSRKEYAHLNAQAMSLVELDLGIVGLALAILLEDGDGSISPPDHAPAAEWPASHRAAWTGTSLPCRALELLQLLLATLHGQVDRDLVQAGAAQRSAPAGITLGV